ncbi:MAG: type II toxin-antitoxin system ParD family antitoxin [Rhizobiaceae bacterium]|nr:type II toxin-antitoxin system ParD family antitoxin [Rhizobiaceae bacterium]
MTIIESPAAEDEWVLRRLRTGAYRDTSDDIGNLIRRDRDRDHEQSIEALRLMVTESLASGVSPLTVGDIVAKVDRERAGR